MAIIKMKKVAMAAMKDDRAAIMQALQNAGFVQIVETAEQKDTGDGLANLDVAGESVASQERLTLLSSALASLAQRAPEKKGMFAMRPEIDALHVKETLARRDDLIGACREIAVREAQIADSRQRALRIAAQIEQLVPLADFKTPLEQVQDTPSTVVAIGTVAATQLAALTQAAEELKLVSIAEIGKSGATIYVLACAHRSLADGFHAMLSQNGFSRVSVKGEGTAGAIITALRRETETLETERERVAAEIAGYANIRGDLELLSDLTRNEMTRIEASGRLIATERTVHMTGWIPKGREDDLAKTVRETAPSAFVEFSDPVEGDEPPTYTENAAAVTPYEAVTNMFSTPNQTDVDPTPALMPFFACFFGMMVSDAAYGLIIMGLGIFATVKLKMRGMMGDIMKMMIICGGATVFWGFLFGSWFGIESPLIPVPLFSPLTAPMPMLGLCCGLGIVHLFTGIIISAIKAFKNGDWQTAVFDKFAWMFLITGLIAFGGGGMLGMPVVSEIGKWLAIACGAAILLFAGRDQKWGVGRIVSGFGSLYGISSYLGDILSYARLFAMGLATGVICMVFNTIAGMLFGSPVTFIFGIVVLLIGHTFNLGINALGAYVHSCRLQYIEYFGKFFDGGGRPFKPLARATKYVDLKY